MQTSYLLVAAAVLATLSLVVSGESFFDFYKLSLQWPATACSVTSKSCISQIPSTFTIHGLWPQYADDTPVKPYRDDPSCTTVTPTNPNQIIGQLQPIRSRLDANWPNLYLNRYGQPDNPSFWRYEWSSHGMCSDYPNKPLNYFSKTLDLAQQYNSLQVDKIKPGESGRTVQYYVDAIRDKWNVQPQITCYWKANIKAYLLWEIRLCVGRAPSFGLRNCPYAVDINKDRYCNLQDKVTFPSSPLTTKIVRDVL